MKYGDKRDYPKIDIFFSGDYICTTTWAKTCKQAKEKFLESCSTAKHSFAGATLTQERYLKHPELIRARKQRG